MSENVAIVDYGSGNLRSAEKALARAADEAGLATTITVTNDPDTVAKSDRVILPGVGAFGDCRQGLLAIDGMRDAIYAACRTKAQPFLGICVGMQLLAREGREHGIHKGMGWLDGVVRPINVHPEFKVPHMGWNELHLCEEALNHPVASVLQEGDHAYFVHSYHMELTGRDKPLVTTDYDGPITAVVGKDNFIGTQFHPEKSQATGLKFLTAFLKWKP